MTCCELCWCRRLRTRILARLESYQVFGEEFCNTSNMHLTVHCSIMASCCILLISGSYLGR
ncbi:hypothetical protein VFPPC_16623 [Pochonia chlamydosporia 170]|uniref:Uncharacterized protein n=1 Tax=Pochonia chlamydosporia 170 TaxID=1380566 RepID=A0A179F9S6_METCM|nr:hypothetical protein VFPPC_16623 [Pochonia chlamydosporia 170]OAQ62202.1 hypothetical protein VFPPC_16623 [Pochonia chlamydosporia 170]